MTIRELALPPPFMQAVRLRTPSGDEFDALVISWVLDMDGTGCAVVGLPDATIARIDRLEHDGWTVVAVITQKQQRVPSLVVP